MKLCHSLIGCRKSFIFTTLLISQFFFSACSSDTDVVQEPKNQISESQTLIAGQEVKTKSDELFSLEDLSASQEAIKPSFSENNGSDLYIGPEEISKNLNHPVNDFTNTLSIAELEYLNEKLSKIYEEGLLQIGIVLVSTTDKLPIFDYSMTVAKSWALGSPENNNGLLILMAMNDSQIYILTGLDIEDKLTDERVSKIINEDMTPHFRNKSYVTGLSVGIDSLVESMKGYQ
ncbi:YgcG family protein [uncultured Psychrobacter sp.]|uniref:TPM domain-containing protein n=1 Tax=uncultured Psychrobacter sp. TaxID=259303 RepID=UPI00260C6971|nr:TPM domain-containing protein [uncultured Psychrobacter sp.]